jgi:hypothetical protein
MSPESKKQEKAPLTATQAAQPSTQPNTVAELVREWEQRREAAMQAKDFDTIDLIEYDGYRLSISINPSGTAALVLISPRLKNRFVIADETVVDYILAILNTFKERDDVRRAVWMFIRKYGRTTKGYKPSKALIQL